MREEQRGREADLDASDPGATARPVAAWVAIAAAAGLIAIVVFASRSATTPSNGVGVDVGPALTAIRVIGYVAIALGSVVLPFALVVARARSRRDRAARDVLLQRQLPPVPWWARLLGVSVLIGMLALQVAIVLAFITDLRRTAEAGAGGTPGVGSALDPGALGHAQDDLSALTIALVIVAAVSILFVALAIRWRLLDQPTEAEAAGRRAAVAEAVELSIDALRGEPDPRRAVIAAYAAMERSLGRAGFGRHRSEAPLEYLRRVIAAATGAGDDVQTLTLLFQHAKFSDDPVEETMRGEAIEALAGIRTAIRALA